MSEAADHDPYTYWRLALAGKKPKCFVDDPRLGFYRKKTTRGRDAQYEPVAVFLEGNQMKARVGGRDITGDYLNELWSWIATNPISEETWRAVAENGQSWPDAHDPRKNIGKIAEDVLSHDTGISNIALGAKNHPTPEGATAASKDEKIISQIAAAKAGVSQYDAIDSDEQASRALSLKNEITALASSLDKYRETLVRPHLDAQQAINGKYNPIINDSKAVSKTLLCRIGKWEDEKRQIARIAQEKVDRERREHERLAAEAEAEGKPAPMPVDAPKPVQNAPAPSSQIAAATGRKAAVRTKHFVTEIDDAKVFAQFVGNADLHNLLMTLAQKAIDAGIPVPGAITEERTVVK